MTLEELCLCFPRPAERMHTSFVLPVSAWCTLVYPWGTVMLIRRANYSQAPWLVSEASQLCWQLQEREPVPLFPVSTPTGTIKKWWWQFFLIFPLLLISLRATMGKKLTSRLMLRRTLPCAHILHHFVRVAGCWASSKMSIKSQIACNHFVWPLGFFFCLCRICREPLWAGNLPKQCALLHKVSTDLRAVYERTAYTHSGCYSAAATDAGYSTPDNSVVSEQQQTKQRVICMLKTLKATKCSNSFQY